MKHFFFTSFLLLFSLVILSKSMAQVTELPHATIHLVRGGNFISSSCRTDVVFPNQRSFNLPYKSVIDYTIYSDGQVSITLEINCPATQNNSANSTSNQVTLAVIRGQEYYILYNGGTGFHELKKEEVQKHLDKAKTVMKQAEDLNYPINKTSLQNIAKKEGKGQGTCFLISSEGYLITNFHCIENAAEITIKGIDGDFTTKYAAAVIASDPSNDLALLKLSNKNLKFPSIPFGLKTVGVAQAEKIYALGYPKAVSMGEEVKITEGIISAKSGAQGDISKFQISAAVNPGNSGGPLIDEEGNVIGVIYAKSTIAESAGYAIKASYLDTFLKNAEGFVYPAFINLLKDKSLVDKTAVLKNYIFIIETN